MTVVAARWTERARCLGEDPETFFPVSETGAGLDQLTRAKAICACCPVLRDCLTYALDNGESAGVWGGATPEERRMLRQSGRLSGVRDRLSPPLGSPDDPPDDHASPAPDPRRGSEGGH